MTTHLELPDDLVREIKLRAANEGKELDVTVTDLLRKALADQPCEGVAGVADKQSLSERRREVAQKFISGEWGTELAGFEEGRAAERESARVRSEIWRR
jgi:plasmid stability protein